jgi:hypothetical protein
LQQPPAWKREPVQVPAPTRTLPPPDESVIDPRAMLDSDDLPRWLQNLVPNEPAQMDEGEVEPPVAALALEPGPVAETKPATAAPDVAQNPFETSTDPVVATADLVRAGSPVESPPSASTQRTALSQPADRLTSPWWLSDRVLGLVLLGIVLAMVYIVLAVSGVI